MGSDDSTVSIESRPSDEPPRIRREPPRRVLGRFTLLDPIATGGMGTIYRAHDPQLERRVALKLVHPRHHGTDRARKRLIAEARVLAQLSHPNVVPVYEVVEV